ncbi:aspartyl protease family protein [Cyclobacterium salsum]|uniref:aspartyl protease family protein n=1 Tax=Cyclobacterium salsum TaxID=2666329 RepID=UPI001F3A9C2C|nr:aspartyl protease family protein [Cyclobacterium salsum]
MKKEKRKINLPFIDSNSLIIMPISINGGPEVNFLFDTGVKSNIFFSKTMADELDMQYTRKLNLVGADGTTVLSASVSPNNHFDLGPIEGIFQAILVLDEDFLELEKVIGIPVFGVIGHEFFKNNPVKIDYDNGVISFYKRSALKWRPLGFRKTEIEILGNKPYVQSTIRQSNGPDLSSKLLIDTGANHGLLLNRETSDEIVLPEVTLQSDLGRSLGGDLFGFVGRVKRLRLNGLKFRNVITSYPEENEFSDVIIGTGRNGSIGSDVLNRMKIIMDYPRKRMLYKKGSRFSNEFKYDMSGLMVRVYSAESKRFYISQVREGSPAHQQGVQVFDEIISINKIPAPFWKLSDITDLLRSKEGEVISLELLRRDPADETASTLHKITFLLEKQL